MQNEKFSLLTVQQIASLRPEVQLAGELERRVYAASARLRLWLPPEGGVPRAVSSVVPADSGLFLKLPF